MKIEAGSKAKIYCLSDKPDGEVISVTDTTAVIQIERGVLIVDKDDIIEGDEFLKVLNYKSIEEKEEASANSPEKFANDMMDTIKAMKDDDKDIYKMFMHFIRTSDTVKNDGVIFPLPCMFEMQEGKTMTGFEDKIKSKTTIAMAGLAMQTPQVYSSAAGIIKKEKPKEIIFGTFIENKLTDGNIDLKFKNVFCIFRMKRNKWMYGVVGYNTKEDLQQQEPNWNNDAWTTKMKALLGASGAIPIPEKVGTAYGNKIDIKLWRENSQGYFYEGDIIIDKLDKNTQRYVKENNLNLNFSDKTNRNKIADFFEANDMKLDFKLLDGENHFVNLMITNKGFIFTDRRSKTRAILEALEALANEKYGKK